MQNAPELEHYVNQELDVAFRFGNASKIQPKTEKIMRPKLKQMKKKRLKEPWVERLIEIQLLLFFFWEVSLISM